MAREGTQAGRVGEGEACSPMEQGARCAGLDSGLNSRTLDHDLSQRQSLNNRAIQAPHLEGFKQRSHNLTCISVAEEPEGREERLVSQ